MRRNIIFVFAFYIAILCIPQYATAQSYSVSTGDVYREEGVASWYGPEFDGRPTASGEIFNSTLFTAAHPTLPFGTFLMVTNKHNNRQVTVKVNDRGPFAASRIIDLSKAAAEHIDMVYSGTAPVVITTLPSTYLQAPEIQVAPPPPEPPIAALAPEPAAPVFPAGTSNPYHYPPITVYPSAQSQPQPQIQSQQMTPNPYAQNPYTTAPNPYIDPYAMQNQNPYVVTQPPSPNPYATAPNPYTDHYGQNQYQHSYAAPNLSYGQNQYPHAAPNPYAQNPYPEYAPPQYMPPQTPSYQTPSYAESYLPPQQPTPSYAESYLPPLLPQPQTSQALPPLDPLPPPVIRDQVPGIKLIPSISPAPNSLYKLQIGSYKTPRNAVDAFEKLKNVGLNPAYEQNGEFYRVVLAGIRGVDMQLVTDKLERAGFREAIIREEK